MKFFATEFGFSATEVVALMGVHTLGSAKETNSGFKVEPTRRILDSRSAPLIISYTNSILLPN